MSKLRITSEATVKDTDGSIRSIVRDLAQEETGLFQEDIMYCGEDGDTCDIQVSIDIYTELERTIEDIEDCEEYKLAETIENTQLPVLKELLELVRETENDHRTFFTIVS